ncbi:hypothetical protein K443DRAFT_680122 [Laccaria amethystina LaAM-08-1]|uniref:Structural maintenance of chromosomes protein n=1 Tax=Laccaria amethystina LaAM-08-1 TaxID=1095629 RepID=A0A0C9X2I9_9AGAR|nr:hypothetical protein K443DRAFT_680122 [Laccaria amethystina LaAM-08-1]
MRIEELVIEGFKSYPVRTTITGWDPSFNAITGLNGSGKSNILDAICFVLGITNMSQMRAANQQDLIYKRGQAGVTKASVTIVFDNSDRAKSPTGYEACKQITVTRIIAMPNLTKYLINGHKSNQASVQTLFQSVQLNINNPNFVIMQGRITKVLNMRPQEILGMVEEAAGTRMFEDRKDKAKRTMGKKEKRVAEITSLLHEEIMPKLEKLRAEKKSFIQYQKTVSELERLTRVVIASEWLSKRQQVEEREEDIKEKEQEQEDVKKGRKRSSKELEAAEKDFAAVTKKRNDEMSKGGKLKKLQDEVDRLGKDLVLVKTQAEIKEESIKKEEENVQTLVDELQELEGSITEKQAQVADLQSSYKTVNDSHTALQTTLSTAEELLQTLLTGLSSKGAKNTGGGYMGQLAEAKQRMAQAAAEEEQSKVKLGMAEKELGTLKGRMKDFEREAGDSKRKLEGMRETVEGIKSKISKCGWSAEKEGEGEAKLREAKSTVRNLGEHRDRVKHNLSRLNFDYTNPTPNFDRSKVKGLAAQLITLPEEHYDKSTALEIAAGGKLFNVVVENELVGKDLLKNGKLKKRVTLIPLNKISPFTLHPKKLEAAQKLAPGKVRTALSLVGYEDEVAKAIAYVFNDTLVCDDADTARKVTFSKDILTKSVTLEGDVYDPSGTLSGGSAPTGNRILVEVQELLQVEGKFKEAQAHLASLEKEEERNKKARESWKQLVRELEIKEHELKLLEEQVVGSNASRIATQVEEAKKLIIELQTAVQTAKDKQAAAQVECQNLERDMAEFKNNKEGKIEELKASISKQKASLQKHSVTVKVQQKEHHTATLELEQLESDLEGERKKLEEAQSGIESMRVELQNLNEQVSKRGNIHAQAAVKLEEELATLGRFDTELKELERVIKEKKESISQAEITLKEIEHAVVNLQKEKVTAGNDIVKLQKLHPWIEEDKDQFQVEGSQYDPGDRDIAGLNQKVKELAASQTGMKKKINPTVMNMIDTVEKREVDLKKMLTTVMKDKEKIEKTIEELDRYKRDALQKTWEKVDGDFGGIFAELLPGNFAKLQPPDGQDLIQGLEVKVRLGTVWKQSLTELSGGQRSLIALSLIMALLQFKPAPMYILDEIDAALDLSHTQHIGHLFRTRFKGSQFIVVSLKEGLFTNANVLFRARFRDGTSIVERTAQRSTSALYTNGDREDEDDGSRNPGRGRRAG